MRPHAPARLFDPGRHEELTSTAWNEDAARAAIERMVQECFGAFTPDGLWPAHVRDQPATTDPRYSMLYLGAGGLIWSLQQWARLGSWMAAASASTKPFPPWSPATVPLAKRSMARPRS